jgi:hypothetical protein
MSTMDATQRDVERAKARQRRNDAERAEMRAAAVAAWRRSESAAFAGVKVTSADVWQYGQHESAAFAHEHAEVTR